jgi:hypothetical protein
MFNRQPKPDPSKIYVALDGFASDIPAIGTTVKRGTRLAGDNPIVQAHAYFFAAADEPDDAIARIKAERFNRPPPDHSAPSPPPAKVKPKPALPLNPVKAKRTFTTTTGRVVKRGTIVSESSDLATNYWGEFERA